jgi:murein DD-endopeptidase
LPSYIDLVGKEFEWGGRGPNKYDCYGLAKEIYNRNDLELPEVVSPKTCKTIHEGIMDNIKGVVEQIDGPEPLCFVGFMFHPPYMSHIGIVLEDLIRFMHISDKTRVCVERLDNLLWKNKITGFYRWKKN